MEAPKNNILFYKTMKKLKPVELRARFNELLSAGVVIEDVTKNAGNKREFVTKCVEPLRLHCVKNPFVLYSVEIDSL